MDIQAFGVKQIRDPKTKEVIKEEFFINPLAEYVKPYTLVPQNADINPTHPEQIIVPANGQSPDCTLSMVDEGLFEGAYLTVKIEDAQGSEVADPDMLFELVDNQRRVSLTGRPCHVQTVLGTGQRPFVLPESLPVDKQQPLIVRFYNLEGSERRVRFQIHGQRMYSEQIRDPKLDAYVARRRERNRHMSLYLCPLDIDPLVGAGSISDYYLTNDTNQYFEIRKITYHTAGPFKFQILDEKNNGMQNGWLHATGAIGIAQYPFIYYGPWLVKPGGKVTFRVYELSAAPNQMYITFSGRQHFVYPGP